MGVLIADPRQIEAAIRGVLRAGAVCVIGDEAVKVSPVVLMLADSANAELLRTLTPTRTVQTDSTMWMTEIMSVGDADEVAVSEQDIAVVYSEADESGVSTIVALTRKQFDEMGASQIAARVMVH